MKTKKLEVKMKNKMLVMAMVISAFVISGPFSASAGDEKFSISGRFQKYTGYGPVEYYDSVAVDLRYFLNDKVDIGFGCEQSEQHVLELPKDIESLDPSGEIDGEGTTTAPSLFAVYHPWGRSNNLDYYVGGTLKVFLMNTDKVTGIGFGGVPYRLKIDTPPAYGVALKMGLNYYFTEDWAFNIDAEGGTTFHDYSITDSVSLLSEDIESPYYYVNIGLGISYRF